MTDEELIARLRERAADEREIQVNNEAVVTALKGQMLLFEQKTGGHNNFAVRLGLQHATCAKNDAALAADWDAAASRIKALNAEVAHLTQERDAVIVQLVEAAKSGLNSLQNTENEFGIILGSADKLRAALAAMKGLKNE